MKQPGEDKKTLTTSQFVNFIKNSETFSDVSEELHTVGEAPRFCDYLYETMALHGTNAQKIITLSGIERSYYYHILSGKKMPGRNMLLRICLCIGASLTETNQLLLLSNHGTLYAKVRRDAALIFAIEKKYTMQQANQLLLNSGELPLYHEESL